MTDATGAVVPNSQAAYLPFGDWRNEPSTSELTDVGYTGHRHNNTATNDLGLIYMNARYYLPGVGRFASADSIVPDTKDSQSFNRYSYVDNNPLNFSDPSGHCKNGRGGGTGGCQILGSPDTSIGSWLWYIEVAPRNGVQMHEMTNDEFAMFVDNYIDGYLEGYGDGLIKVPDAIGINISISGSGGVHGDMGLEWIYNFESHEFTTFVVTGIGGGVGASGEASFSGVAIYNLGESNHDYRGTFLDGNATVSAGPGLIAGHARVPGDLVEGPSSYYVGVVAGAGASLNASLLEYIPIHTIDMDDLSFTELFPTYAQEAVFTRFGNFIESIFS